MDLTTWLTVVVICSLGAMSPGPSLAVVLRHTLAGGRLNGSVAAVTHGVGIGLYAFACISGLAFLVTTSPRVFTAFQWSGAAYMAWLGIRSLMASPPQTDSPPEVPTTASAGRDGFLIAFLNPKIAIWFIALFSQVIGPDTSLPERSAYAATAWFIDTAWYLLVAWLFSSPLWIHRLQAKTLWFERLFGVILLALAGRLVIETLA